MVCAVGGTAPTTLAEFTLQTGPTDGKSTSPQSCNMDFYDVSVIDGYNVGITVIPVRGRKLDPPSSPNPLFNGGTARAVLPALTTTCTFLPPELLVVDAGHNVSAMSMSAAVQFYALYYHGLPMPGLEAQKHFLPPTPLSTTRQALLHPGAAKDAFKSVVEDPEAFALSNCACNCPPLSNKGLMEQCKYLPPDRLKWCQSLRVEDRSRCVCGNPYCAFGCTNVPQANDTLLHKPLVPPSYAAAGRCSTSHPKYPRPTGAFALFASYPSIFKKMLPNCYTWQFDDMASTFTVIDADYHIVFGGDPNDSPSSTPGSGTTPPEDALSSRNHDVLLVLLTVGLPLLMLLFSLAFLLVLKRQRSRNTKTLTAEENALINTEHKKVAAVV